MSRQGLAARRPKRRRGLTAAGNRSAPEDLLGRDFTAAAPNRRWVGDFKQAPTAQGPVFLATVIDLFSRRVVGFATSDRHPTAELAEAALNMAAAIRGGDVTGAIFHTDKGSQGGFNRSSQHLVMEVFDGEAVGMDGDAVGAAGDAVAGSSAGST